jgi:uncharacterized repeat protein (TIGR03987 family)
MSSGIIFINSAFVFYTIGVWSEKIQGELKRVHLILFWFGIICDVLGTRAMGELSKTHVEGVNQAISQYVQIPSNFHSLTGIVALSLMLLHACWATIIIVNKKDIWKRKFHRYSLVVWILWLIPFISGAVFHFM